MNCLLKATGIFCARPRIHSKSYPGVLRNLISTKRPFRQKLLKPDLVEDPVAGGAHTHYIILIYSNTNRVCQALPTLHMNIFKLEQGLNIYQPKLRAIE